MGSRCVLFKQPSLVFWYSSSNWLRQTSWSSYSRFKFKILVIYVGIVVVFQLLSHVWLFATPWTAACQTFPFINSWSLLKLMFIESVMPSNHPIFCCPLFLLPSVFPNVRVFSSGSTVHIRWPKYLSFSSSISPSSEYSGLISFRIDWLDLLAVHETLKSLLKHHNSKTSFLALSFLYGPSLTFIHDYSKIHSFNCTDLCQQSDVSLCFLICCLG